MEIRPFLEIDQAEVVALWREVFAYGAPHNDPALAIQKKLAVQRELFFVALEGGEVVGTIMGGYDGHRGWMYSLAVAPRWRCGGFGRALMTHCENALAARGCLKINLQVVASNAGVVALYSTLGYTVEERISMGKVLEIHGSQIRE